MRFLLLLPMTLLPLAAASSVVVDVRTAIERNDFSAGESDIERYRAAHGVTPEFLEALSWLSRGALAAKQLERAETYAKQTQQLAEAELKKRPLDTDPHLPIALGAAIEVQAQTLSERGQRAEALAFLRQELALYRGTSIRTRIQKNINLLNLEGKPAPSLDVHEFLGPRPTSLAALHGKPVLLFFWAHWCGDCKTDEPIVARLKAEFASKGLTVIAPTQRYGYAARGEEATPQQETQYIEAVRQQFYRDLLDVPAPISEENLKSYGASTTPTFVLIDRHGVVRLYHPGAMTLDELRAAVRKIS